MRNEFSDVITVEVAYALPQVQTIISLTVKNGTTAMEAIQRSGLLLQFPDIALMDCNIGIFGKMVSHDTVLLAMDRVEIYRPLIANPKEARRLRALTRDSTATRNKSSGKNSASEQKKKMLPKQVNKQAKRDGD